ncbi:MAG: CarD family transcriptional regulator [Myxococcales bacterium]|nr:CarD family transcriptional regulator [Myxococcales bacterium]
MDFKIGEKAVYPRQGVTEVLGVESKEIMGTMQDFYVLRVLDTNQNIYIPVAKVEQVGLREVIDDNSVGQVYDILKSRSSRSGHGNWNRRYRAYNDKLNTGSATEIAEVLRDLNNLKSDKNLSFGERKMLDTARRLLVQELSVAEALPEDKVESRIESCFG